MQKFNYGAQRRARETFAALADSFGPSVAQRVLDAHVSGATLPNVGELYSIVKADLMWVASAIEIGRMMGKTAHIPFRMLRDACPGIGRLVMESGLRFSAYEIGVVIDVLRAEAGDFIHVEKQKADKAESDPWSVKIRIELAR